MMLIGFYVSLFPLFLLDDLKTATGAGRGKTFTWHITKMKILT